MKRGKKSIAERIMYGAMDMLGEQTGEEPLKVFRQAVDNVRPVIEVRSRRVGGVHLPDSSGRPARPPDRLEYALDCRERSRS